MPGTDSRISIGDDGYYYGILTGDRVEFATSEMDGLRGNGEVVKVIEDGFYVISVEHDETEREVFALLVAAQRHLIQGNPDRGWTLEVDGTGITNAWEA